MEKMSNQQRLEYLINKRKWLLSTGMDLRPNRLKEMLNLMGAGTLTTESDESIK